MNSGHGDGHIGTPSSPTASDVTERHHVVIVGAGFGGLAVARHLRGVGARITLVEANNFHTFPPLLYQVATAGLAADDVGHPVRPIFHGRDDVDVMMARVVGVDVHAKTVSLDDGGTLADDSLVLACGAVSNSFGIDGVDEHALPLKELDEALAIRDHIMDRFEAAHLDRALVEDGALDVVVSGGGPTGVEVAGGLAELYRVVLAKDFPTLPVERARITVVEPADRGGCSSPGAGTTSPTTGPVGCCPPGCAAPAPAPDPPAVLCPIPRARRGARRKRWRDREGSGRLSSGGSARGWRCRRRVVPGGAERRRWPRGSARCRARRRCAVGSAFRATR